MTDSSARYTEDMSEISGFGGSYEQACRDMVIAGVEWFKRQDDPDPTIKTYRNVTGIAIPENEDAEALEEAMLETLDESPTGAMFQAAVNHVLFAAENGWEAYAEKMEREANDE